MTVQFGRAEDVGRQVLFRRGPRGTAPSRRPRPRTSWRKTVLNDRDLTLIREFRMSIEGFTVGQDHFRKNVYPIRIQLVGDTSAP